MTALAGRVGPAPSTSREQICKAALAKLARYGFGNPKLRSHDAATFGIDLFPTLPQDEFDAQPAQFGPNLLLADIRIDNRADLAATLGFTASSQTAMPDSALLASAWRKWGSDSLSHIVGDFAVAVFSASEQKLWLARSLSGNRPLFYATRDGATMFASMPNAILADPAFRNGFDLDRLATGLADDFAADDRRSNFRGISRVLPNHLVTIEQSRVTSAPIWAPSLDVERLPCPADYVEAYRSVLDTCVGACVRVAGTPIASQLSAGYDSSGVTGTAARLVRNPRDVIAFTAAPRTAYDGPTHGGQVTDESPFARLTANMHSIRHEIVRSRAPLAAYMRAEAGLYQDPFRNVLNSGWDIALRQRAAELGCRSVLTGDLGNLTLNAGGIYVLGDLVTAGEWLSWVREAAAARSHFRLRTIASNSFEQLMPDWLLRLVQPLRQQRPMASKAGFLRREWMDRRSEVDAVDPRHTNSRQDRWAAVAAFDSGCVRKGSLAETGTETRDPLIDRRVVQFSLSLPPDQLFSNGVPSPLARKALSDRVPNEVLKERIRGYQSADWHEWFTPALARSMTEEIAASATAQELIDFDRITDAIDNWPNRRLGEPFTIARYTHFLPRTLAAGFFLLEFEGQLGA